MNCVAPVLSTEQEKKKKKTGEERTFKGQTKHQSNTAEGSARQQQDPMNEDQQSQVNTFTRYPRVPFPTL